MFELCIHIVNHYSFDPTQYPDAIAEYALPFIVGVMALLFPILFSVIARLDEKYKSEDIYLRFLKDSAYRFFYTTLIIALVMAAFYVVCHGVIIEIVGIVRCPLVRILSILLIISVFVLIISTIVVIDRLLTYYNPSDLLKYISKKNFIPQEKHSTIRKVLFCYSIRENNIQLFDKMVELYKNASSTENETVLENVLPWVKGDYFESKIATLVVKNIQNTFVLIKIVSLMQEYKCNIGLVAVLDGLSTLMTSETDDKMTLYYNYVHGENITDEEILRVKPLLDKQLICVIVLATLFINKDFVLIKRMLNNKTQKEETLKFIHPSNFYQVLSLFVAYQLQLMKNNDEYTQDINNNIEKGTRKEAILNYFAFLFIYFYDNNLSPKELYVFKDKDFILKLFDIRSIIYNQMAKILSDAELMSLFFYSKTDKMPTPHIFFNQLKEIMSQSEVYRILKAEEQSLKMRYLEKMTKREIDNLYQKSNLSQKDQVPENFTEHDTIFAIAEIPKKCLINKNSRDLNNMDLYQLEILAEGIAQDAYDDLCGKLIMGISEQIEHIDGEHIVDTIKKQIAGSEDKFKIWCPIVLSDKMKKICGTRLDELQIIYVQNKLAMEEDNIYLVSLSDWVITPETPSVVASDIAYKGIVIHKEQAVVHNDEVVEEMSLSFKINKYDNLNSVKINLNGYDS